MVFEKPRVDLALHNLGQAFNRVLAATAYIHGFGSFVSNLKGPDLLTGKVKIREG